MSMPEDWKSKVNEWQGLNYFSEAEVARFERLFNGVIDMETPIGLMHEIAEQAAIAARRVGGMKFAEWCERYRRGEVQPTPEERDAWLEALEQSKAGSTDLASRDAVREALSRMSPHMPVSIILPIACAAVVHAACGIGQGKAAHIEAKLVELALLAGLSLARVELAAR